MKHLLTVFLLCLSCSAQWLPNNSSQSVDAITQVLEWDSVVPASTQVRWAQTTSAGRVTGTNATLTTAHSVTLGNLLDGTTYYWRPVSIDADQVQAVGKLNSFTTPRIVVTVAPASPTLTSGGKQQFTATVAGVSNQAVTWTTNGGTITTAGLLTAPTVSQTTTLTVTATSKVGAKRTGAATVTVNPAGGPPPTHSVTLNWQPSATQGVLYRMYRGAADGGPYTLLADNLGSQSYVDLNVVAGNSYYYVVRAFDSTGESDNSNQAQAVIPTP